MEAPSPLPAPAALPLRLLVSWQGERRYSASREGAPPIVLDGDSKAGPGAVDAVVSGLAACSAIDVVDILAKRRTPVQALEVDVRYARAQGTPRRLTHVHLIYRVRTASARQHVERALQLSREKYCSVYASLDPDIVVTTEVEVQEP